MTAATEAGVLSAPAFSVWFQMLELTQIISDLAVAMKAVDAAAPVGRSKTRTYQPGIGPLTEAAALKAAFQQLAESKPDLYRDSAPKKLCDVVIRGEWAIEAKLIRPFGDNGEVAEHWSENVLHPYAGNVSSIGDCLKLGNCDLADRTAVVMFGYEHTPPRILLEPAVRSFELIAREVLGVKLGQREESIATALIHPVHQQIRIYGWEVL